MRSLNKRLFSAAGELIWSRLTALSLFLRLFEAILPSSGSFHLPRLSVQYHIMQWKGSHQLYLPNREAVLEIVYILSRWSSPVALVVLFFPLFPSSASSMKENGDYRSILLDPRGPFSFQTWLCLCVCGRKPGQSSPLKGSVTHPWRPQSKEYKFLTLHYFYVPYPFLLHNWMYCCSPATPGHLFINTFDMTSIRFHSCGRLDHVL